MSTPSSSASLSSVGGPVTGDAKRSGEAKGGEAKGGEAKDGEAKGGEVKGLDDSADDDVLKLVSQEGEKVPVTKKVAMMSELVKTMAEGGTQTPSLSPSPSLSGSPPRLSPHHLSLTQRMCLCGADKEEKEIPLPNVKSAVLHKVVAYLKYHVENPAKEIEKPLKSANMNEVVSQWDADFVDVEQELLFELILVTILSPSLSLLLSIFSSRAPVSCGTFVGAVPWVPAVTFSVAARLRTTWTSSRSST
jgi:Skp1 family, tetramerisation domain